jgi:hypothetical protein
MCAAASILAARRLRPRIGELLAFAWLGTTADEAVPAAASPAATATDGGAASDMPTAKALALLQQYGLGVADVKASGARLSADDVRRHATARGLSPLRTGTAGNAPAAKASPAPDVPGTLRPLQSHERGMLHTVNWQRDVATPGYIEMAYDAAAWDQVAASYGQRHQLLRHLLLRHPLYQHQHQHKLQLNPHQFWLHRAQQRWNHFAELQVALLHQWKHR